MDNKLGEYIKKIRADRNLTLRELEKITGVSYSYLSSLERGYDTRSKKPISPTLERITKIAVGLNIPLGEFLISIGYAENDFIRRGTKTALPNKEGLIEVLSYFAKTEKSELDDDELKLIEKFTDIWWDKHPIPNKLNEVSDVEFELIEKYRALPFDARNRIDNQLNFEYEQSRKG